MAAWLNELGKNIVTMGKHGRHMLVPLQARNQKAGEGRHLAISLLCPFILSRSSRH